ncbi:MAG: DUF748 domain-containing protein, partial [Bacteroidales bacterium]|nr:DUF748 domain-containing protein [Bacteroidales bacterium]
MESQIETHAEKRPRKKRWLKLTGGIAVILFLLLLFLSTMIRVYLVKNSEKIIGRKIALNSLNINYLNFSLTARNFVMYEKNGTDEFVSFDKLHINFSPLHLLKNEYAFTEISLVTPKITVIYSASGFNFDDLLESKDSAAVEESGKEPAKPVKFLIRNLSTQGGYIRYVDQTSSSVSELKQLAIRIPEIAWNKDQSDLGIEFVLGENGKVALSGSINQIAGTYSVTAKTENIDLEPFKGYLSPYMDISSFAGLLGTNLTLKGDLANPLNFKAFGDVTMSDCQILDKKKDPFFSAKEMYLKIDSIDWEKENYSINTIRIDEPVLTAILDKEGTNFDRVLAPFFADTLTSAETADTPVTHYSINQFTIQNGAVSFTDLSLNRQFRFDLSDIVFSMEEFNDTAGQVKMDFDMALNKTGSFTGKAIVDMVKMNRINFDGAITNLDMISFSPYSEYYIARPITKGTFNYACKVDMTPDYLKNDNRIKIVNLETGRKTKDKAAYKVPVGLALYILKDRHNIIGFDLPVTGNPSDPSFKLGKLVWKTLENFFIKTATAPFNAIAGMFGTNPESIRQIPFEFLQDSLTDTQRKNADKIVEILAKKPELLFTFTQSSHPEKEKELIAVQLAKKLYTTSTPGGDDKNFRLFLGMNPSESDDLIPVYCLKK